MTQRQNSKTPVQKLLEREVKKSAKARKEAQDRGFAFRNEVARDIYIRLVSQVANSNDLGFAKACELAAPRAIHAGNMLLAAIAADMQSQAPGSEDTDGD